MGCWVHNGKPKAIFGYFHEQRRGAKSIGATLTVDGTDYFGRVVVQNILAQQRGQDLSRRLFAVAANSTTVHVCTCRWTKAQLDEAKRRAAELCAKLEWASGAGGGADG